MLVFETDPGQRLRLGHVLGNYRLIRKLGEGGVGTVYEAEHIRLGRKMALKVLHPETASAEVIMRFFNEARAVNQIRHPNIVDVEDFVVADTGEHYLVMELLAGEDLRGVITREGVMAPQRVSAIGEQIAGALSAIHAAGILHRDLKPDNIFLTRKSDGTEVAKLLDFGIAKFLTDKEGMTRAGMTLGTPEYMAPEQILATGKPGPRADIYSLGMLMYECVAGAPAFTATTTAAILRGHINEPVVPPSHRRGEPLPAVLEAAILKCLEKAPENRFSDGIELAAALRADRAVELVTPRYRAPTAKPARNRRILQMLPAFAMAAAAAVLHLMPKDGDDRAVAAPAPVTTNRSTAPNAPATEPSTKPAEAATAAGFIDITLVASEPAELFIGEESLGEAPTTASLRMSNKPVTVTARFADGSEVAQTIVPDRPVAQIAFIKPQKKTQTRAVKPTPRVNATEPKAPAAQPTPPPSNTLNDRDGTMDPFK